MSLKQKKNELLAATALFCALGGAIIFHSPNVSAAPPMQGFSVKVEAIKVVKSELNFSSSFFGTALANESVDIRPEINGRIISADFKEGSDIKKGATLFRLDSSIEYATLKVAEANFEAAKNNAERHRELIKSNAVSKKDLDDAEASFLQSKATAQLAQANLARTNIRAPFDGVAGIRKVSVGDTVNNAIKLVSFEQTNPMRILFSVPEKLAAKVKPNQKITIKSDLNGESFEAIINAIDSKISPDSRSLQVQALAENKERKLLSGQYVKISLPVNTKPSALMVPDQALIPLGDKIFAFKVIDGKAQKTEVKIGTRLNSMVEVLSGISEGELLVTAGQQKLQDGAPVRISDPTPVKQTNSAEVKE